MPRFPLGFAAFFLLLLTGLATSPYALAQGSTVSGTATLDGVAAAGVDLVLSSGVNEYAATTDDAGFFAFEGVELGTYYLFPAGGGEFAPSGYVSGDDPIAPIFVESGADVEGLELDLQLPDPSGRGLYGGVYDATTGLPFNFVLVILEFESQDGNSGMTLTLAAPSGYYSIQLSPGIYTVTATAIDFGDGTGSGVSFLEEIPAVVEVTDAAPTPLVLPFTPLPSGTLAGTVTLDSDPGLDYSVLVSAVPTDGGNGIVGGLERGVDIGSPYMFDYPVGDYYVRAQLLLGSTVVYSEFFNGAPTVATAEVVTIDEDQTTSGIDFTLPIPDVNFTLTISGTVTTADGEPIEGAFVVVQDLEGNNLAAAITEQTGAYTILSANPGLASRELVVQAIASGFEREYYDDQPTFFLADLLPTGTESVAFDEIDFDLAPIDEEGDGFALTGTVLDDETSAPIEGALVIADRIGTAEARYGWTGADGAYRIDGLDAGEWVVLFTEPNFVPTYYPNATTWPEAIPVVVADDVPGIDVRMGGLNRPVGSSREEGQVAWPVPDSLFVTSNHDGPIADIVVSGGATARVTGVVRDEEGATLPGVLVVAQDAGGAATEFAFTGPDGVYYMDELGATTVTIRAEEVGREVAAADVFFPQGEGDVVASFSLSPQSPVSTEGASIDPNALDLIVYPNPVSTGARVAFETAREDAVTLRLYDTLGRVVQTVVDGRRAAGFHVAELDVDGLAAGVYFLRLMAGGNTTTQPLTIVR